MGTLFNQEPRRYLKVREIEISDLLTVAKKQAKEHKIEVSLVLEAYRIKEMERRNNLYADNGDIFDEQMQGFGELFQELNQKLDRILSMKDEEL